MAVWSAGEGSGREKTMESRSQAFAPVLYRLDAGNKQKKYHEKACTR